MVGEMPFRYFIQKVLGPLPPDQVKRFTSNPNFRGLKFPWEHKRTTNSLQEGD